MIFQRKVYALLVAILAMAGGLCAADQNPVKPVVPGAAGSSDLQKLISQFTARRDTVLADRQQLLNQLKSATEEQRKAILQKMQEQEKDLIDAQRALGKQIRDQLRKLRPVPAPGHH